MNKNQKIPLTLLNGKNIFFDVKNLSKSKKSISKAKFFDILESFKYLFDMSDQVGDLGLDLTIYEAPFYELIEKLLLIHYSESQVELIFFYVSEARFLPKTDRQSVEVPFSSGPSILNLSTREYLWKALNKLSHES